MKAVIGTRHYLGPDWFHIDADKSPLYCDADHRWYAVDLVCDAISIPLPDGCFEEVFSTECLEHFPWHNTGAVVKEWARLLAPGGRIRIEVPDFAAACQELLATDTVENHLAMQQIFFAEQINRFDFHYAGLTHLTLPHFFREAGLEVLRVWRSGECGWLRVDGTKLDE